MPPAENDFERRVRESEEALLRQLPPGKRPVTERWWWFVCVTATFWSQLLLLGLDLLQGDGLVRRDRLLGLVAVAGVPLFAWARARGARARAEARGRG